MKALILSVTHADDITLIHSKGIEQNLSLAWINVPSEDGDLPLLGSDALKFIRDTVLNKEVEVTISDSKEVEIYLPNGSCLNDLLVDNNLAVYEAA